PPGVVDRRAQASADYQVAQLKTTVGRADGSMPPFRLRREPTAKPNRTRPARVTVKWPQLRRTPMAKKKPQDIFQRPTVATESALAKFVEELHRVKDQHRMLVLVTSGYLEMLVST